MIMINPIAFSIWNPNFKYEKGKMVQPEEPFCENRFNECESGIHFFMTFNEAMRY